MAKDGGKNYVGALLALFRSKDNTDLRNVRLDHLKYMLIFPLAPVFANMQKALFSDSIRLLGLSAMTLMGSAYCVGAGVLFAFTNVLNMARASQIFAGWTFVSYLLWSIMAESQGSLLVAIVFMLGLGGCAACACFAYTFVLNNTERLLGAAAVSLYFALHQLDYGLSFISGFFNKTYLTGLVVGTVVCLSRYKKEDFEEIDERPPAVFNSALKLVLYFFVAHYFVEIFYTYLPGASSADAMLANGAVGILVVCLVIVMQLLTKSSVWNMCNIFFVAAIITYALYFGPEGSAARDIARFTHGFEQMGYIAAYYLLGCVFKKHGDFRIFKLCVITILPVSMVSYVIPGLLAEYAPDLLPLVATVCSSLAFVVFVLLSPAYSRNLFSTDWSAELVSVDMSDDDYEGDGLDTLGLSPREKQVMVLLLEGRTAKQIAQELGISVHTANFHVKNLYKKCDIRTRSELFARFSSREISS